MAVQELNLVAFRAIIQGSRKVLTVDHCIGKVRRDAFVCIMSLP